MYSERITKLRFQQNSLKYSCSRIHERGASFQIGKSYSTIRLKFHKYVYHSIILLARIKKGLDNLIVKTPIWIVIDSKVVLTLKIMPKKISFNKLSNVRVTTGTVAYSIERGFNLSPLIHFLALIVVNGSLTL
jgi:hypothetical protein